MQVIDDFATKCGAFHVPSFKEHYRDMFPGSEGGVVAIALAAVRQFGADKVPHAVFTQL